VRGYLPYKLVEPELLKAAKAMAESLVDLRMGYRPDDPDQNCENIKGIMPGVIAALQSFNAVVLKP
jgi:hypothetical protein